MKAVTTSMRLDSPIRYQALADVPHSPPPCLIELHRTAPLEIPQAPPSDITPDALVLAWPHAHRERIRYTGWNGALWQSPKDMTDIQFTSELEREDAPLSYHDDPIHLASAADFGPYERRSAKAPLQFGLDDAVVLLDNFEETLQRRIEACNDVVLAGKHLYFRAFDPCWSVTVAGNEVFVFVETPKLNRGSEPFHPLIPSSSPREIRFPLRHRDIALAYAAMLGRGAEITISGEVVACDPKFLGATFATLNLRYMLPRMVTELQPLLPRLSAESFSTWKTTAEIAKSFTSHGYGRLPDAQHFLMPALERLAAELANGFFPSPPKAQTRAQTIARDLRLLLDAAEFLAVRCPEERLADEDEEAVSTLGL